MNRLLRLLQVWLRARRAPTGGSPLDEWRTPLRVYPNDIDLLRHVNNGVYLTLLDIGRIDMTLRTGASSLLAKRGWFPVVVAESIRFRRSLTMWERFTIVTRTLGWDERNVYLAQRFERAGRGGEVETVAEAWIAARFLAKTGGTAPIEEVVALFGSDEPSPQLPQDVLDWARSVGAAAAPKEGA